jgi:hypothetical protein
MPIKTNIDGYLRAVRELLGSLSGWVEQSSKMAWIPAHGALPIVRSSIIRRQYECLGIAVDLAEKGQGFAAVGLLRPACEELLWAKYLGSIARADAERVVTLMARMELCDSLRAQEEHAGATAMKHLGLATYARRMASKTQANARAVRELGVKLRWEKRTVEGGKLPSMAFVAKSVNETKLYKLLYHASSRYVHFSPHELMRRAWGKTGEMSVSSSHFADYWGSFVLYWGTFLLAGTFAVAATLGEESELDVTIDGERLLKASETIGELGPVPIITAGELDWE